MKRSKFSHPVTTIVLIGLLVFFTLELYSIIPIPIFFPTDSASCGSGDCTCECHGWIACECWADAGSCSCFCAKGQQSECGPVMLD